MNDRQGNTTGSSARAASLDALSRTIDSLESRIERLVTHQHGGSAGSEAESAPQPERIAGSGTSDRFQPTGTDSIQREITDRQHMLDRERADLETRLAARRPAASPGLDPAADRMLREIAESLVSLRDELKTDIADGLTREVAGLRAEIGTLKSNGGQPLPPAMREELVRLASCIERLGERGPQAGNDALAQEVRGFHAALEQMAGASAERRLGDVDSQTMRGEVAAMASRVEDMQKNLADMVETGSGKAIEDRLKSVTSALATLAEQVNLDEAAIDHRFGELGERLDEISQAIVAIGTRSDRTQDGETLSRIEKRVEGIVDKMDSGDMEAMEGLTARLTMLTQSIDSLASEDSVSALGTRIDQLSSMLEQGGARQTDTDLAARLMDISDKIDLLGEGSVSDALARRLDGLAERIDDVASGIGTANQQLLEHFETLADRSETEAGSAQPAGIEGLENRLADIARRLDETRAAPADNDILRSLESQLAHLSELISGPSAAGVGGEALETRLSTVEEHLETNDEYIIEAARQAAEAVVAAYAKQPAGQSAQPGEMAAISDLAEDLRALEQLNQQSDVRTARAFDAVHDTLVKIADHLENLGGSRNRIAAPQPASERGEATVHSDEDDEMAAVFASHDDAGAEPEPVEDDGDKTPVAHVTLEPAADALGESKADIFADKRAAPDVDLKDSASPETAKAKAKRGLLGGLGRRSRKGKAESGNTEKDGPSSTLRTDINDAPALDPSDAMESDASDLSAAMSSNEPLEPGSGAPDLDRIFKKVRDDQEARGAGTSENSDFIAAARRAAQAAAAEVETTEAAGRKKSGGLKRILSARRRPILLAVGAVLLVVMSWPLVSTMLKHPEAPTAANQPANQVAQAALPKVSNEKTGATNAAGPALPKVRAVDEAANSKPAGDSQNQTPATTQASTEPAAAMADTSTGTAAPIAVKSSGGQATQDGGAAAQTPPSIDPATDGDMASTKPAPATQPQVEAASAITTGGDAKSAAADVADVPSGSDTVALGPVAADSSAVPAIPEAIGPESLRLAANKGDSKALFEIGARYTDGRGVGVDLKQAAKWYMAAADRNLAPAEYRLANFYEKGQGVQRDTDLARKWYEKAAEQGNVSAMHNLAVLDALGRAGKPDYASAAKWFRKAADHGVKDSQFNLAILYAQGNGVPRDLKESYKWFALAASSGNSDALQKRDQVAASMSRDALTKARAAVGDWKPDAVDPAANTVDIPPAWSGKDTQTASIDMSKAVRNIQVILDNNGFDAGKPDGIMGARTRAAIKAFQKSAGQEPTGDITDGLIKELLALNKKQQKSS